MVNNCGPDEPHNSRKPFIGNRDVPVTNCKNRVRSSVLNDPIAYNPSLLFKSISIFLLPSKTIV